MKTGYSLNSWQKKQAALLYHFSSMNYLKGLKDRVHAIRALADGMLDQSRVEGRDRMLRSAQWGERDTGENWANTAWPFLADFQHSIARDIADRAAEIYRVTGRNQCARGMAEFSMQWSTPAEQERFDKMFTELSRYARNIDQTMNKTGQKSKWDDFGLTIAWQRNAHHFSMLPKFSVLSDVTAESGNMPPRTGVYLSIDDPNATLQFAWTGNSSGRLLECATLNELGKAALATVDRPKLWVDGKAMLDFVLVNLSNPELRSDPFFGESQNEDLAPSLVARNAFTSHSSRWCFVELLTDEFEPIEIETEKNGQETWRYESGTVCQNRGWYFTPAHQDSRRCFEVGEIFPELNSKYGKTIWQLDAQQKAVP
jgi:hypothetical protein